ncbi:MAG: regulatory protein RecX [Rhodothermales bacterium]
MDLRPGSITSIRAQSQSPDRVSVYIDDAFAFGMHRDLLLEFDLAKGTELTVDKQQEIVRRDAFFKARAAAVRYLSYRDRSAAEIRRRLERGEYGAHVIEDVVHDLEEKNLVDDHRFALTYAEGRFHSGGYGPVRVRSDLMKKGVKTEAVDAAVSTVFSERDEVLGRAREMGVKRWGQLEREDDPLRKKKKVYDYLARRGFPFDMARRIVNELQDDT